MARPRTLTDQERAQSNAKRQARWREKHKGLALLKNRNRERKKPPGIEIEWEEPVQKLKREPREVEETYYAPPEWET